MINKNRNIKVCLGLILVFITSWSLLIPFGAAVQPKTSATGTISSYDEWSVSYGQIPEGDTIRVSMTVTSGIAQIMGILDSDNRNDFMSSGAVYWRADYGSDKTTGQSWSDSYVAHDTDTFYFCVGAGSGGVTFTYTITHDSVALGNLMGYIITGVGSVIFLVVVLSINMFNFTGNLKDLEKGSK